MQAAHRHLHDALGRPSRYDWSIHAIKMGYPVFWTALLVPLALLLGKERPRARAKPLAHAPTG